MTEARSSLRVDLDVKQLQAETSTSLAQFKVQLDGLENVHVETLRIHMNDSYVVLRSATNLIVKTDRQLSVLIELMDGCQITLVVKRLLVIDQPHKMVSAIPMSENDNETADSTFATFTFIQF